MKTVAQLRSRTTGPLGETARRLRNIARRVAIRLAAASGLWELGGVRGKDEDEVFYDAENFSGIGFFSRPKSGSKTAEVVVLHVGAESGQPVIVATRDKATQVTLDEDETAIFNSTGAKVVMKKNGDIEVTCKPGGQIFAAGGGGTDALVKKSEFLGHTHGFPAGLSAGGTPVTVGGGPPLTTSSSSAITGTTVFKAE